MRTISMIHPWHDVTPGDKLPNEFIDVFHRYSDHRRRGFKEKPTL